ncbi:MAG: CHRD domain-containing protein [Armatimonadota bacterium]
MRTLRGRWWWLLFAILLLLPLVIAGCDEFDDDDETRLQAVLTGLQEVPPVTTSASGSGSVTLPDENGFFDATLQASGFATTVIAAHIHYGRPGENGPILFTLFDATTDGTFPGTINRRFTAADFEPQPLGSPIDNFAEAVDAIRRGDTYFNVHTTANPEGEIRGQIGARFFATSLAGSNVVPPVTTTATGDANAVIARNNATLGVGVTTNGLTNANVTAIRINYGDTGEEGPVLFTIFDSTVDGAYTGRASAQLTSADLETQPPGSPVDNFGEALEAIEDGNAYISVETTTNPGGEIRGQFSRFTIIP